MHDGANPFGALNTTNGHVKVEQVPFTPAIARYHSFNIAQFTSKA